MEFCFDAMYCSKLGNGSSDVGHNWPYLARAPQVSHSWFGLTRLWRKQFIWRPRPACAMCGRY